MPSPTLCAIHQPNFFPRLSTLAKLFTADAWVVLDDVQFVRRDYQHHARLRLYRRVGADQWLTLLVHLPLGCATAIKHVVLADSVASRVKIPRLLAQHYAPSPHWPGTVFRASDHHVRTWRSQRHIVC